jgi:serine O-acetyltransferase
MIQSKRELEFYIAADRIMNGRPAKRSLKEMVGDLVSGGGGIIRYLRAMRMYAFYANTAKKGQPLHVLRRANWGRRFRKLGMQLGFSIGHNSLGYGVVLPHFGTIVVNGESRVGNFAVLHTCSCIAGKKVIGDYLYLSTGSQITGDITLGNGVSIAAHSLVNKSSGDHVLLVGSPAEVKRTNYPLWVERDGEIFVNRVKKVEQYRSRCHYYKG